MPQHPVQARADLLEQLVADIVTERVVDLLETVEVHHEQGKRTPGRAHRRGAFVEAFVEMTAVGQFRERVGERQAFEHAVQVPEFGAEGVEILRQLLDFQGAGLGEGLAQARAILAHAAQLVVQRHQRPQRRVLQHQHGDGDHQQGDEAGDHHDHVTGHGELFMQRMNVLHDTQRHHLPRGGRRQRVFRHQGALHGLREETTLRICISPVRKPA